MAGTHFPGALSRLSQAGASASMALIPAAQQNLGGLSQLRRGSKNKIA